MGVLCITGRQLHIWGICLRPNFVVVADLYQLDHEGKTINQQAQHPKASFGSRGLCHFSALGVDEIGLP